MFISAALFAATLLDPSPSGVCLADAARFPVDSYSCRASWNLAKNHKELRKPVMMGWNGPEMMDYWEQECHWRERCWYLLDDAKWDLFDARRKLDALARLRDLLGDEAYYAGWMPAPIPTYKQ